MKVLLDHDVPHRLRHALASRHEAYTTRYMRWEHLKNGLLLKAAHEAAFHAFVTLDQNLRYQQSLTRFNLAIIELVHPQATETNLLRLMPAVLALLDRGIEPHKAYRVTP